MAASGMSSESAWRSPYSYSGAWHRRSWGLRPVRSVLPVATLRPPALSGSLGSPAGQPRSLVTPRSQPGSSQQAVPSSDPDSVAAYLDGQGISITQLQQEQPAAFAQLLQSPPLAQLLVELLAARKGVRSAGTRSVSPAEFSARLVFLASEAGLAPEDIDRVYVRHPDNLHFNLESARAMLSWLGSNLPDPQQVPRVLVSNPTIVLCGLSTLQTSKRTLQRLFNLTDAQWVDKVLGRRFMPAPSTAQHVVDWLRSDAVGMSEADVLRVFKRRPGIFSCAHAGLSQKLEYVLSRLSIPRVKAGRLVLDCAGALAQSQASLESKVAAFEDYGFTAAQVGGLALRSGVGFTCNFQQKTLPTLSELERLLLGDGPTDPHRRGQVIAVVIRAATLLSATPTQLRRNFEFLRDQGLSVGEARQLLSDAPQVFVRTLDGAAMSDKLWYYEQVLGISTRDMLLQHTTYLKEGLAKVDRRVFFMERRGELHRLTKAGKLSWAVPSDSRFCARFGVSLEEWRACEVEWQASERARGYGLVGTKKQKGFNGIDFALASARMKEGRAKASSRRAKA